MSDVDAPRKSVLQAMLTADDIVPGSDVGYQMCKQIYLYHPLGLKIIEAPLNLAFSQQREVKGVPEAAKNAFTEKWKELKATEKIYDTMRIARIYGIATLIEVEKNTFSVFDPLNTAGSLVLNQVPSDPDFLKVTKVEVENKTYGKADTCVMMNEAPIYLGYTNSAFGYVGRSCYQRALFPLRTFLDSMRTDDMVTKKAGVLVAKMKQVGAITDKIMKIFANTKRQLLKDAETYNVISISTEEEIATLDLTNTATAMTTARNNVLDNIAAASDMPAIILKSETLNQGFGEGTEDSKVIAHFVDRMRTNMHPLYEFFVPRVQNEAWSEAFYEAFQNENPEYQEISYNVAMFRWKKTFNFEWPNLLTEPDSEKIKKCEATLKAVLDVYEKINAVLDPEDRKQLVDWLERTINSEGMELLFPEPLLLALDYDMETPAPTEIKGSVKDEDDSMVENSDDDTPDTTEGTPIADAAKVLTVGTLKEMAKKYERAATTA